MLIGYIRVSKADGSQVLDLQRDALIAAGVATEHLYEDFASGTKDERDGLNACLKALRPNDMLVVWKLDRLGRNLKPGQGAQIDTTTSQGKLVFGIFAALAEFERDLIVERTNAGLASARARGRKGGARYKMTPAKLRLAIASMGTTQTHVGDLCRELGITKVNLPVSASFFNRERTSSQLSPALACFSKNFLSLSKVFRSSMGFGLAFLGLGVTSLGCFFCFRLKVKPVMTRPALCCS
jgi:hypothetical protein